MIPSFKQAVDRLFDRLGLDALYRVNGEDIPVKIIMKSPDQIVDFREAQIHTPTNMMEVRVMDIAKPKAGDEIILDDASYRVQGEPVQDTHHLVWKMEVLK
ncbi:hypothetical protein PUV47_08580 [Pseudovibrio exalbescens]|uniref:head-tail joining protein n=1 Tax=Pseudovibrio exalbescens TaxID=197461 RepID=UPI002366FA80|nr:hypothetical protein [Pseudovibrio exalbescens]MDD7909971.1 hypothetical protein [Pseudovibrio exalbescens]